MTRGFLHAQTLLLPAVVFLAVALHASDAASPAPDRFAKLQRFRLPGGEEDLWRGKLTVFENRQTRTGRTIDLHVVVVPALEPAAGQVPLFDLAGGPGAAASDLAFLYAGELKEYRRHRDIVLVDQRGTGKSNPLAADHDPSPAAYLAEMYPEAYVKKLRQKLEQKADLTQYTTPIAMDDLDDVRAWLGYEKINLSGLSYGTRAALVYLRQYPQRVRSVLLTSVTPTYHHLPLYFARDGQRALNLLLEDCASDPEARKAFPNIRTDLAKVLVKLERSPARVRYASPDGATDTPLEIHRDIFMEKLRALMYAPFSARRIPLIIHEAARGNFEPFLAMAIPADRSQPNFIADGLYLCVTASEDTAFIDPAAAEKLNAGNVFGNYRVIQQVRAFRLWPRAELPAGYGEPVKSTVPVLIISGHLDPVTPPSWAAEVARHLPNSRQVILRHGGHVVDGLASIEKLDAMIVDFLATAEVKHLDPAQVEQLQPPPFLTEWTKTK